MRRCPYNSIVSASVAPRSKKVLIETCMAGDKQTRQELYLSLPLGQLAICCMNAFIVMSWP